MNTYDIVVVGGGPAGYSAAIKASRLGAKVALVEKSEIGGTCLNRGCIPTKHLLHTAHLIDSLSAFKKRGIQIDPSFEIDMSQVHKEKDKAVKKLVQGVKALLKTNNIEVFHESATIENATTVKVGEKTMLECKAIILATGTHSRVVPIPGIENEKVLNSTQILEIPYIPKSLAVIGGGVIGLEIATIFSSFGSQVTVIEGLPDVLSFIDKELRDTLVKKYKKKGIEFICDTSVVEVLDNDDGINLVLSNGSSITTSRALLSIGRTPDVSAIQKISHLILENGFVQVNEYMESSIDGIFCPGDMNGKKLLAHAAYHMGEVAAINAVSYAKVDLKIEKKRADLRFVPSVVYSHPEIGTIGMSTQEATEKGYEVASGRFNFMANGRSLSSGETDGYVEIVSDKRYGEILGVHIIGSSASELINEAATLMSQEITVHELKGIIHAHPTLSEAIMEAGADALKESLHSIY